MTQSGGAIFFLLTVYNFQKSGRAVALPAPASPRSLQFSFRLSIFLFTYLFSFRCNDIVMHETIDESFLASL